MAHLAEAMGLARGTPIRSAFMARAEAYEASRVMSAPVFVPILNDTQIAALESVADGHPAGLAVHREYLRISELRMLGEER